MPSWQSYVLNPILRLQVKRKLAKARNAETVRKAFGAAIPPPPGARYSTATIGGLAGEWTQAGGTATGTVLYLHGGGYMACSPKTHRPITAAYALRGLQVFTPDYRLAPEHPFPAAVEDGLAAYKGLLESGVDVKTLAVSGDSAGGGLALAVVLAAKDAGLPLPAAVLVFSPWTDLAITGATIKTNLHRDSMLHGNTMADGAAFYLNGADAKNPLASPLYGDYAGFPPLFITVGEAEVLRDDAVRLRDRAEAAGVHVDCSIWENMPHVWQLFQFMLPEARVAMDKAAAFAKAHFIA
ncbi:MAG: alpha/beta hydrolase [Acidocella sp. 20-57-95]|nr:MAG: alpha/beta hydrolase [Acidocella sp. 20-57-95]OYV61936.1 MAG: alpha/beta hydrolase [Acidocella sp. 21-58-7]HQT63042.1 alpha/beta hydrolase [Acidocella sp.]HQU03386.1 alpha/beta hydrolase [Acidocella sp.]